MNNPTILLIEDLPLHAALAIKILEHAGFTVIWKESAELGLEELQKITPNLFLIDISLPGMSGVEFVQELKKNPLLASIHKIAITAHATQGTKEMLLAQGFTDYLTKPCTSALLISTVKKNLKIKE